MQILTGYLISRSGLDILVSCDTEDTMIRIVKRQHQFMAQLIEGQEPCERIILISPSQRTAVFYPPKKELIASTGALKISEPDLITEIMKFPGSSALVRMIDDKGIFTNSRCAQSSGISAADWVGKRMSSYWIGAELIRYKEALLNEKKVAGFTYTAYLLTGEMAQFQVDSQLVMFGADLCRWVKILRCEVI